MQLNIRIEYLKSEVVYLNNRMLHKHILVYILLTESLTVFTKSFSSKLALHQCSKTVEWSPSRKPKVVGGQVPPFGAMPWQITLRTSDNKHLCGGALISERLVLSAAHCYMEGLSAVAGAHGPPGSSAHEQVVKVEKFITHPDFSKLGPYSHDIAILILSDPGFHFDPNVKPVCLPREDPPPGTWCEVSGWGAINSSDTEKVSNIIQAAAVPIISLDTCRTDDIYGSFHQPVLDSMLCAGHLGGDIDACKGDSGGPLVCANKGKWELAGIVSWGDGCARKNRPGMYTSVASFAEWIEERVGNMKLNFSF